MNENNDNSVKIAFLGDVSLNDEYNKLYENKEKPFKSVKSVLFGCDFVVGNIECLSESIQGENLLKKPRLKAKLETLNYLKDINLGLACLSNNHVYDNLEDGFQKTTRFLNESGISYMGASMVGDESEPYIYEKNGIQIAILNYLTHDTNPNIPLGAAVKPNWFSLDKAIKDIKNVRKRVQFVVVYPHWGGTMEGSLLPDLLQIPLAHALVDAGADIIIGHHSHTIQPYEVYNGKYIFYSLGNFCFANIVSDGKLLLTDLKRRGKSVLLTINFLRDSFSLSAYTLENKELLINVVGEKSITKTFRKIPLWTANRYLWRIYVFYEKNVYSVIRYLFYLNQNPLRQLMKLDSEKVLRYLRKLLSKR